MAQRKQPKLFLHELIGAMSYWGTTTRMLLVSFIIGSLALLHMLDASTLSYVQPVIYVLGCLMLLDAGYVTIARSVPFQSAMADKLILWLALLVLSVAAVVPYVAVLSSEVFHQLNTWLFAIVIFVLSVRLVLGLIQTPSK